MRIGRFRLAVVVGVAACTALTAAVTATAATAAPRASEAASCPSPYDRPVTFAPRGTINDQFPVFSWSAVPGANEYVLKLLYESPDAQYVFPDLGLIHIEDATSYQFDRPLPVGVGMRWAVKWECDETYGFYSDETYFNVSVGCPARTDRATPIAPSGVIGTAWPVFQWTSVPGAEAYVLKLLYAPDEAQYVFPDLGLISVAGTSYQFNRPLPTNVWMRWAVKTRCGGSYGYYSAETYFMIAA